MGQIQTRQVKTFSGASLTGSPQNFGTVLSLAAYKLCFINGSNKDVTINDGTGQDAFYIIAGSTLNVGEGLGTEGKAIQTMGELKKGTQLTITSVDGTAGTGTIVAFIFGGQT